MQNILYNAPQYSQRYRKKMIIAKTHHSQLIMLTMVC